MKKLLKKLQERLCRRTMQNDFVQEDDAAKKESGSAEYSAAIERTQYGKGGGGGYNRRERSLSANLTKASSLQSEAVGNCNLCEKHCPLDKPGCGGAQLFAAEKRAGESNVRT